MTNPFIPERLAHIRGLALVQSNANNAVFACSEGEITVTAFAPSIFRVTMGDRSLPEYPIMIAKEQNIAMKVEEKEDCFVCKAFDCEFILGKEDITMSMKQNKKEILPVTEDQHFVRRHRLPALAKTEQGWFVSLALPFDVSVYGGGERYGTLNRRGDLFKMWNEDALGVNSDWCYKNVPFFWTSANWGVFVNTPSLVQFGVGYSQWSNQNFCIDLHEQRMDLFFICAENPTHMLERYTFLTGKAPKVPLWSLGCWLSKAYYKTPEETMAAAKIMREKQVPCDVITLDGRAWQDTDTRYLFEWCPKRYDDPKAFCDELKALDYKICVWEYPIVSIHNPRFKELSDKGYFMRDANNETYIFKFDPTPFGEVLTLLPDSGLIDFTNPEAYQFWKDMHKGLFEVGVDSMKVDFGEQILPDMYTKDGDTGTRVHNVTSLLYNLCAYEAAQEYFGDQACNWARSGWAGSQRAPIHWAGDTGTSWGGLTASILGGLSYGMSGYPYYSHDIGGFYGEQPDAELFVRWTQVAAFFSHMRFHGIGPREPWAYGTKAEEIVTNFVKLRYRLLPYIEDACTIASQTGLPVQRAMVLAFPEDKTVHHFEQQFMLGDSLLVCPVLAKDGKVSYRLPQGLWYDFWTGQAVEGGMTINTLCPLDRIPLFVKAGSVLKLGPMVQHTGEIKERVNQVVVYGQIDYSSAKWDDYVQYENSWIKLAQNVERISPENLHKVIFG